jgi:hypothetical protein
MVHPKMLASGLAVLAFRQQIGQQILRLSKNWSEQVWTQNMKKAAIISGLNAKKDCGEHGRTR